MAKTWDPWGAARGTGRGSGAQYYKPAGPGVGGWQPDPTGQWFRGEMGGSPFGPKYQTLQMRPTNTGLGAMTGGLSPLPSAAKEAGVTPAPVAASPGQAPMTQSQVLQNQVQGMSGGLSQQQKLAALQRTGYPGPLDANTLGMQGMGAPGNITAEALAQNPELWKHVTPEVAAWLQYFRASSNSP